MAEIGSSTIELSMRGRGEMPWFLKRTEFERLQIQENLAWANFDTGGLQAHLFAILFPDQETPLERIREQIWKLPESTAGPCLVYLRRGDDVVSRPALFHAPASDDVPKHAFAKAVTEHGYHQRQNEIRAALQAYADGATSDECAQWFFALIARRRGLPAASIDALAALPGFPKALVRLAVDATEDDLPAILSLEDELPFLWLSLPLVDWREAFGMRFQKVSDTLSQLLPGQAHEIALSECKRKRTWLGRYDSVWHCLLAQAGIPG